MPQNRLKIFFRVDGGNVYSVGMGHVYRCLKIADFLDTKKQIKSIFIMRDRREGVEKVIEKGYRTLRLPENIDEKTEISSLEGMCKGQILIMDIRSISNNYFVRLNNTCKKTICFDDLGNNDYSPHYLINPSVTLALQKYKKKNSTTKYLIGEKYFILGSSGFKVKSEVSKVIKRVLVSLGGADPANYTPSLLKLLEELPYNFKVTLVLGPAFNNFDEVNDIVRQSNLDIEILVNVKNMGELMFNHDLAFVAGGDTALELAYTGTPGILVPTIDYENTTAEYLERKEVFVNLGDIQNVPKVEVIKKIDLFWKDYEKRRSFSDNSKRFIDGRGLSRIMAETALC
jgi:UDP-2,4-diacetamido-2,4,6-trideoxy-beta-L-altropyranose hydrolase